MKRILATSFVIAGLLFGVMRPADAYDSTWTRDPQAWNYARAGVFERYVYGGSTFRNNDHWDGDEGADCSGYASKVWAIEHYTDPMQVYHPYSTATFYNGFGFEVFKSRSAGSLLNVWVYRKSNGGPGDHMGLFRTRASDGSWTTYEAKGANYGIVIGSRTLSQLILWNYKRSDRVSWG